MVSLTARDLETLLVILDVAADEIQAGTFGDYSDLTAWREAIIALKGQLMAGTLNP